MSSDNDQGAAQPSAKPRRPYSETLGHTRIMGELLGSTDEKVWLTKVPKEAPHHKYVVWLGCQVLRTPQLAETLNDIFGHFAVDHVSLGGPTSCCGIAHDRAGDTTMGEHLTRQTVKKFTAFTPEQMLYWCPSCDNHLRQKGEGFENETTRRRKSVVGFLSDFLTPDKFRIEIPLKVVVHTHSGSPEQDADGIAVRQILSRIPGLAVIPLPDVPVAGRHCNDTTVLKFGKDRFKAEMREWITRARGEGVDRVISLYHSCHRQMNQVQMGDEPEGKIRVENYLTLIARSLGLPEREDKFSQFAEVGDVEKIIDDLSGKLEKSGINRETARRALATDFDSSRDV